MERERTGYVDRPLMIQAVLILVLIGLGTVLFFRPVAADTLEPRWWHWLALGGLFFTIVALHSWRMKHRSQRTLREVIREDQMGSTDEDPPPV